MSFAQLKGFWFISYFLLLSTCFSLTSALRYKDVLSDDPSFSFLPSEEGAWSVAVDSMASHGSLRVSRAEGGVATITRTFQGFHFASPLWPFPIQVEITVDDVTATVDLQDHSLPSRSPPRNGLGPASKPTQTRWGFRGSINEERTITISAAASAGGWAVVVDTLILEIAEPDDIPVIPGHSTSRFTLPGPRTTRTSSSTTLTRWAPTSVLSLSETLSTPCSTTGGHAYGGPSAPVADLNGGLSKKLVYIIIGTVCVPIMLLLLGGLISVWIIRRRYKVAGEKGRYRSARSSCDALVGDVDRSATGKPRRDGEHSCMRQDERDMGSSYKRPSVESFQSSDHHNQQSEDSAPVPSTAWDIHTGNRCHSSSAQTDWSKVYTTSKSPGTYILPKTFAESYVRQKCTSAVPDNVSICASGVGIMRSDSVDDAIIAPAAGVWHGGEGENEPGLAGVGCASGRKTGRPRRNSTPSLKPLSAVQSSFMMIVDDNVAISPASQEYQQTAHTRDSLLGWSTPLASTHQVMSRSTTHTWTSFGNSPITTHSADTRNTTYSRIGANSNIVLPSRMSTLDSMYVSDSVSDYPSTQGQDVIPGLYVPRNSPQVPATTRYDPLATQPAGTEY